MTRQARFVSGEDTYDLAANGWHIPLRWQPPTVALEPVVAAGTPAATYGGGQLAEEWPRDSRFDIDLTYKGNAPDMARRTLEAFLRRGVARRDLEFQLRQDIGHDYTPLWGQWGAWQRWELIHAAPLRADSRVWLGDERDYSYMQAGVVARPFVHGQAQELAKAKGNTSPEIDPGGELAGLDQGVTVADDDASFLIVPASAVSATAGTITIAWQAGPALLPATNHPIFYMRSGLGLWWNNDLAETEWEVTDGTDTAKSADQTYPANGSLVIFHMTWQAGNFSLYKDGSLIATEAQYTAFTPDDIYIGTDDTPDNGIRGIFRMMSTYTAALTAAEIAADEAQLRLALADVASPSPIPYLWTPNGDHVFDNCRDDSGSTGAPHYNYGWISGLAGSAPAELLLDIQMNQFFSNIKALYFSLAQFDEAFDVLDVFADGDIGAEADSNSWSGNYSETDLDVSDVTAALTWSRSIIQQLAGQGVTLFVRGGDASITPGLVSGYGFISQGGEVVATEAISLDQATSGFGLYRLPRLIVPQLGALPGRISATLTDDYSVGVVIQQATGASGSNDYQLDALVALPGAITELATPLGTETYEFISIYERESLLSEIDLSPRYVRGPAVRRGDVLRPHPHRQNLLMTLMGAPAVNPRISWYFTILQAEYTPRWSVI